MIPRRPVDVPMIRRELHEYATDGRMLDMYYAACSQGKQPLQLRPGLGNVADAQILTTLEAARLKEAELFFVDEDLSDLLEAAYPTMPTFTPKEHDLPTPYGFVLFARPLVAFNSADQEKIRIVAVSWGPWVKDSAWAAGGAWFTFWSDTRYLSRPTRSDAPSLLIDNEAAIAWTPDGLEDDERFFLPDGDGTSGWARMVMCMFQLARQANLAETATERTPHPERIRTKRAKLPPRDVRVVRLRRNLREARESGGIGREYQHRWIVRGHWRNHWYPAQEKHRPLWIAPYLKGPAEAPLIGGERVTVL